MTNYFSIQTGNLFSDTEADCLGQGVNICGVMGAGIAKQFRRLYPEMYLDYRKYCLDGSLTAGNIHSWYRDLQKPYIYNLASQDLPGPNAKVEWLESSFITTLEDMSDYELTSLAIPAIGCGIGGLDIENVTELLSDISNQYSIYVRMWIL